MEKPYSVITIPPERDMMTQSEIKEQYLAVKRSEFGTEADGIIKEFTGIGPKENWVFQTPVKNAIVVLLDRIDALKKQLAFADSKSDADSSPVSSGTPFSFNVENPDRVEPL